MTALLGAAASAEQPQKAEGQPRTQPRESRPARGQSGQQALSDDQIVAWLAPVNRGEMALAKLALDQANNSQVKRFAERMIQDHKQFEQDLREAFAAWRTGRWSPETQAADAQNSRPAATGTPGTRREDSVARGSAGNRPSERSTQPDTNSSGRTRLGFRGETSTGRTGGEARIKLDPWVAVHEQVERESLSMMERELKARRGAEFDKAYIGQQIGAHIAMIAALKTLEQSASGDLRNVLAQAAHTAQEHLDVAKQLCESLNRQTGVPGTANPLPPLRR